MNIDVIIEISAFSDPIKYEYDHDKHCLKVDRFLKTPMRYPCNYGFMPKTLCGDGDPIDILVPTPFPLHIGSCITVRPIGVLCMHDESGDDPKILAVTGDDICDIYTNIQDPKDMEASVLQTIEYFFSRYKDLDSNKWSKCLGWENATKAKKIIQKSLQSYQTTSVS